MYCPRCGSVINNNAKFCPYCGLELGHNGNVPPQSQRPVREDPEIVKIVTKFDEDRKTLGLVLSLFFGFIPFIVGLFIFPEGTRARETFFKGCWIALIVYLVLCACSIIPIILYFVVFMTI